MSSFKCEQCGKMIIDSPAGYITGCGHYPLPEKKKLKCMGFNGKHCHRCKVPLKDCPLDALRNS